MITRIPRHCRLAAVAYSLAIASACASADPDAGGRSTLRVDLGPDNQNVEPGWERWSTDRDQNFATGFDLDFEIEISRDGVWRDQGELKASEQLRWVLRDGVRERDDEAIRLTVKRLEPGDYVLELFSCNIGEERRTAVGRFDVAINGDVVLRDQATMGRTSLSGAALPPISITSDGTELVVELIRREGEIWLNGFALTGRTRWEGDIKPGRITLRDAPAAVRASLARELEGREPGKIVRRIREGALYFVAEGETSRGTLELGLNEEGVIVHRVEDIEPASAPSPVSERIENLQESGDLQRLRRRSTDGRETFVMYLLVSDTSREKVILDADGGIISWNRRN